MHESSNFKTKTVSGVPWTPGCKYASRPPLYQNMKYFTFCQEEEENKQISMGATYTRHFEYVYKMCKSLSFFSTLFLEEETQPLESSCHKGDRHSKASSCHIFKAASQPPAFTTLNAIFM